MHKVIQLTQQLIKIKSTDDRPEEIQKCLDILEKKFNKNFIVKKYTFRNRPILVLSNTHKKEVDIILAGHIDVVPAQDKNFEPITKGDKLFGRGAYDMKGPFISAIFAVNDFLEKNNNLTIAILITPDEELDGLSTKFLVEEKKYKGKFAILPDGGREAEIITHQKGFMQLKIEIIGKSAHASRPWEGDNPIKKGNVFIDKLSSLYPDPKNRNDWKTSVVITKVETGQAINQIPNSTTLFLDIRYIDEKVKNTVLSKIKKILGKDGKIEIIAENGALTTEDDNPYVVKLKKSTEKILKKKAILSRTPGTSDAVFLSETGTPSALTLPLGGGEHQDGEWVSKKSLLDFYKIILDFLKTV